MMSNGTPPARPDDVINTRWLFPQERAPSSPRDKGCKHNGSGDPALLPSNGSRPTPSPPSKSTSPSSSSTSTPPLSRWGGKCPLTLARRQPSSLTGAFTLAPKVWMEPSWLIFAAANGFGNHRLRIWVMIGILSQSQIPRAHGTVSQVPADGFSLMKSQVGSRDTTGTWLRTLLDQ